MVDWQYLTVSKSRADLYLRDSSIPSADPSSVHWSLIKGSRGVILRKGKAEGWQITQGFKICGNRSDGVMKTNLKMCTKKKIISMYGGVQAKGSQHPKKTLFLKTTYRNYKESAWEVVVPNAGFKIVQTLFAHIVYFLVCLHTHYSTYWPFSWKNIKKWGVAQHFCTVPTKISLDFLLRIHHRLSSSSILYFWHNL